MRNETLLKEDKCVCINLYFLPTVIWKWEWDILEKTYRLKTMEINDFRSPCGKQMKERQDQEWMNEHWIQYQTKSGKQMHWGGLVIYRKWISTELQNKCIY